MSYLNHDQIVELCAENMEMLAYDPHCINAASLDVRLGNTLLVERFRESQSVIDYRERKSSHMSMEKIVMGDADGYVLRPGEFILANTIEHCNFRDDTAALFRIKSSMGRIGLEHMDAGWVDPGFHGSLTLEFKNMSQWHHIRIRPGDPIGQLIFFKGTAVNEDQSYRTKGNYNGASTPVQIQFQTKE